MKEQITDFLDTPLGWYSLGGAFLFYLFVALVIHRRDRIEIMNRSIKEKLDMEFHYSWRGVKLIISGSAKRKEPEKDKGPLSKTSSSRERRQRGPRRN